MDELRLNRQRAHRGGIAAVALRTLAEQLRLLASGADPARAAEIVSADRLEAGLALDRIRESVPEGSSPDLEATRHAELCRAHTQLSPEEVDAWAYLWDVWAGTINPLGAVRVGWSGSSKRPYEKPEAKELDPHNEQDRKRILAVLSGGPRTRDELVLMLTGISSPWREGLEPGDVGRVKSAEELLETMVVIGALSFTAGEDRAWDLFGPAAVRPAG